MPPLAFQIMQTVLDFLNTPILLAILAYLIYMARKLGEFNVRLTHLEDIHKSQNTDEGGQDAADTNPTDQLERHRKRPLNLGIPEANQP